MPHVERNTPGVSCLSCRFGDMHITFATLEQVWQQVRILNYSKYSTFLYDLRERKQDQYFLSFLNEQRFARTLSRLSPISYAVHSSWSTRSRMRPFQFHNLQNLSFFVVLEQLQFIVPTRALIVVYTDVRFLML